MLGYIVKFIIFIYLINIVSSGSGAYYDGSDFLYYSDLPTGGEAATWGNGRENPCIRYYTGVVNNAKIRNKNTIPGWRTRLHFRGNWNTFKNNPSDSQDYGDENHHVKCRRKPNWRRLRPVIKDYNYYY